ncbi:unnamed protein product [Menidia menidia]|uniref:(Atlantic silverside) hypothetical protein n=1 Tax=Menidia menidia TaxID=238744 RepID=A0A8S4BIU0_9TELE|nr:unnamed protein product [Menidia menidia]
MGLTCGLLAEALRLLWRHVVVGTAPPPPPPEDRFGGGRAGRIVVGLMASSNGLSCTHTGRAQQQLTDLSRRSSSGHVLAPHRLFDPVHLLLVALALPGRRLLGVLQSGFQSFDSLRRGPQTPVQLRQLAAQVCVVSNQLQNTGRNGTRFFWYLRCDLIDCRTLYFQFVHIRLKLPVFQLKSLTHTETNTVFNLTTRRQDSMPQNALRLVAERTCVRWERLRILTETHGDTPSCRSTESSRNRTRIGLDPEPAESCRFGPGTR